MLIKGQKVHPILKILIPQNTPNQLIKKLSDQSLKQAANKIILFLVLNNRHLQNKNPPLKSP